jgi:type II secretory pathway pseudopilin PulG
VWIAVWLLASLVTLMLVGVFLAFLVSQLLQVGRAAQRFQDEVGGLASDISRSASRAEEHAGSLRPPRAASRG